MPAAPPAPPQSTDDKPVFEAWRAGGASEDLTYTAVQKVRDMAGAGTIHRIEALLAAQSAKFEAKFDALSAKVDALQDQLRRERAMLWAVIALLGAAVVRYIIASS